MASAPNANTVPQPVRSSTFSAISRLVSRAAITYTFISVFLLVPCFWHTHIEAGDLGSHVYNAWLAELAQQGRAPGVYLVWQWNNVLFDLLLFYSAKAFGFLAAERIAVSISALIFFWGIFALLRAVGGKSPWWIAPFIAMLTYGYIFHMGFMNYYLSLGLACVGLAFAWPLRRNGLIVAALLCPLMLLAHPIGFLWFLGTIAYRILWPYFPSWWELLLPLGALLVFVVAHVVVSHHVAAWQVEWRDTPFWRLNGTDQFRVFGGRYNWFAVGILVFVLLATAIAWLQDTRLMGFWKDRRLLFELYFISFLGTALLPENLLPNPTGGWIGALVTRLTLISAILGLCWLASLPPCSWHLPISAACALVFFIFIYQDTAFLNRMEASADRVTRQLPFGTRAASTIFAPIGWRIIFLHIPDRACIGHCFLISNYEPSTGQFRVRVHPGSPVVTSSVDDSEDMQSGIYDVQDEDLPLKQIYQCQANDLSQICIRDLAEDEKNDRLGYHPPDNPFFSQNP
ncbi:MAG TPA: hypothetical protein VEJ47_18500 [Candidatus Eremiobacteraceae bacterium]|nr:hypothetical protein [Candidatus Eremiobacteraceae bacterium]